MKRLISNHRGRTLHKSLINLINQDLNTDFQASNKTMEINNNEYSLLGRIDGIDTESANILEIKTKSNINYSGGLNVQDRVQCLCYLKLVGFKKCLLVECGSDGKRKVTEVYYDERDYSELVHMKLIQFIQLATEMKESEFVNRLRRNFLY